MFTELSQQEIVLEWYIFAYVLFDFLIHPHPKNQFRLPKSQRVLFHVEKTCFQNKCHQQILSKTTFYSNNSWSRFKA